MWEAFLVCTGVVALAEMGDKRQIATVMLAARFDSLAAALEKSPEVLIRTNNY